MNPNRKVIVGLCIAILVCLVLLVVVIAIQLGQGGNTAPRISEIETKAKAFAVERHGCKNYGFGKEGSTSIRFLQIVEIGEFSSSFGGWPIYANYEVICVAGTDEVVYQGQAKQGGNKVALAYARKRWSQWELYIPKLFELHY